MEIKNIHKHAEWFASYMNSIDGGSDAQGQALVRCQIKKIKQLTKLIETIKEEIELIESPKEYDKSVILNSIKTLIKQTKDIEYANEGFKWVG